MTSHLLDLEKCVPPEGNLFVLVIPFYTIILRKSTSIIYHYTIYTGILCQIIPFWDALQLSFHYQPRSLHENIFKGYMLIGDLNQFMMLTHEECQFSQNLNRS
jgi:hypothetical protein